MRPLSNPLLAIILLLSAPAIASEDNEEPQERAEAIILSLGIVQSSCLNFVDETAVRYRSQMWARAIHAIGTAEPDYVFDWMIGAADPPPSVLEESQRQKDCMLEAMVAEAAKAESSLTIDWGDRRSSSSEMQAVALRFKTRPQFRRSMIRTITRSHYRDAKSQGWIWKRKFDFRSNSFNRISEAAGAKCNLTAGHSWKPDRSRHKNCWRSKLTDEEREQEILVASSAPGISRHHWGTEFDLFSLNPMNFVKGAKMHDEYLWMRKNAVHWGFFQTYSSARRAERPGYMDERWHWSYYPIAHALLEFGQAHEGSLDGALNQQWDSLETRWNRRRRNPVAYFSYVRSNWRHFVFNVDPRLTQDPESP